MAADSRRARSAAADAPERRIDWRRRLDTCSNETQQVKTVCVCAADSVTGIRQKNCFSRSKPWLKQFFHQFYSSDFLRLNDASGLFRAASRILALLICV